jgi:hypothetical protein
MRDLRDEIVGLRDALKLTGDAIQKLRMRDDFRTRFETDSSEMHANAVLAFRHIEDARMRLGKVLQAYDGGVSCYDK